MKFMRIGLLFAGQGAQYPGMGRSLYEKSPAAKKVFDDAGEQIKEWCFNGTKEMLKRTRIMQPCIYTVTMAAYHAFWESVSEFGGAFRKNAELTGAAGFSLGEYAALTAAEAICDIGSGLEIVIKRGELMLAAGADENGNPKGGMAAAFGKRREILDCVESARGGGILECANFNSQVQTVVAGDNDALGRFRKAAAENRVKVIPLTVGTAFHSPMMAPVAEPLRRLLIEKGLQRPAFKIYCNLTGDDLLGIRRIADDDVPEYIADVYAEQVKSPVYWQETVENMVRDGVSTLIELGPGTTLCKIAKKVSHDIDTLNIEDWGSLERTISWLRERMRD